MAKTRDRIFIIVIAVTFLVSSVGVSVAALWAVLSENKDNSTETAQTQETNNPNALKGKQMQDFTPVQSVDKLEVIDLQPGTGQEVKAGDQLTVDYTGAVATTGKVFESSLDSGQQATLGLDQVIDGWKEGLVGMKVGGKRRLVIPAEKAYGAQSPSPDIPANSPLVFDITLHKIGQ